MFPALNVLILIGLFTCLGDDPAIKIKYNNSKIQIADILTKGQFSIDQWSKLRDLAQILPPQTRAISPVSGPGGR